jgi:hypothetical protein
MQSNQSEINSGSDLLNGKVRVNHLIKETANV